jgi:uncharacterized repeat protein (TIGR04076 family)
LRGIGNVLDLIKTGKITEGYIMADNYKIKIKVISQNGSCAAGHKVGDEWVIPAGKTPEGICLPVFALLYPSIRTLTYGGEFPWETDKDATTACCSDAVNPVVFEIKRIKK